MPWNGWKLYFESRGYTCTAPAWPHKDAAPEELRNRPSDDAIVSNRLDTLTDYFTTIVNTLPAPPILIGHSLGGLVVQLLLQRGLGAAGVAIHSFPPAGVNTIRFSFVKTMWDGISLFIPSPHTYLVSFRRWEQSFANGMNEEQQKELYYKYAVPESKGIIRDAFKCGAKINFEKAHAPLLFTSGSRDRIIPATLNYHNYKKYESDNSVTDYREFKNHNHLVFDQPQLQEEAEFILCWLQEIK